MPAPSTISHNLIKHVNGIPTYSVAGSLNNGLPLPGLIMVNNAAHCLVNLPTGGRHYMPSAIGVNRHGYSENFSKLPALNAVLSLPGSDSTSPTAAALLAYAKANKDFEVSGTNMTTALATRPGGGGVLLTTAGASNDQALLGAQSTAGISGWAGTTWKTDDCVLFETTITTSATITNQKIFAGLKLTSTPLAATDANQAYFLYDTGNTDGASAANFIAVTSRGGTLTVIDTGIPIVASTTYVLTVLIDPDRVPYFFINGALVAWGNVAATAAFTVANGALTTAVTLKPFAGTQSLTSAARAVTVRSVAMSKLYND